MHWRLASPPASALAPRLSRKGLDLQSGWDRPLAVPARGAIAHKDITHLEHGAGHAKPTGKAADAVAAAIAQLDRGRGALERGGAAGGARAGDTRAGAAPLLQQPHLRARIIYVSRGRLHRWLDAAAAVIWAVAHNHGLHPTREHQPGTTTNTTTTNTTTNTTAATSNRACVHGRRRYRRNLRTLRNLFSRRRSHPRRLLHGCIRSRAGLCILTYGEGSLRIPSVHDALWDPIRCRIRVGGLAIPGCPRMMRRTIPQIVHRAPSAPLLLQLRLWLLARRRRLHCCQLQNHIVGCLSWS